MKQLLLVVAAVILATQTSHAQPADSTAAAKVTVARRLYDEGVDAIGKGRWSLAHERFKASYDLAPRVLTLFNLAGSQAQTGRMVEAAESYRRFLRETTDGRYPELRTDATTQLELLEKQIGQVTLEITNLDPGDVVAIDDIEFPQAALREPIPMNPGPHTARIKRGDVAVATRAINVAPGAGESVHIELPAKKVDLTARDPGPPSGSPALNFTEPQGPQEPKRSLWKSPWLWAGVGVVVVAAGTTAYIMTRPDDNVLSVK